MKNHCLVAVLISAGSAWAADPLEIAPYHPRTVVTVSFGPADDQLGPCSPDWGMHEASSFPPFTVGADGTVFLTDGRRNRIMIFSPAGSYQRSLPMLKKPNLVDDLVEYAGALYWMGESMFGRRIYRLDLATGDTLAIPVASDPELDLVAGRRTCGALRLMRDDTSLVLWKPVDGTRYPILQAGRILPAAEQLARTLRGGQPDSPAIGFTLKDTVTATGERTHGDIVLLDRSGHPEKILARNTSHPLSAAGRFVLSTRCVDSGRPGDEGRCYVVVTSFDSQIVTQTVRPRGQCGREIMLRKEYELRADGSFYQLFLTENSGQLECHVDRWTR